MKMNKPNGNLRRKKCRRHNQENEDENFDGDEMIPNVKLDKNSTKTVAAKKCQERVGGNKRSFRIDGDEPKKINERKNVNKSHIHSDNSIEKPISATETKYYPAQFVNKTIETRVDTIASHEETSKIGKRKNSQEDSCSFKDDNEVHFNQVEEDNFSGDKSQKKRGALKRKRINDDEHNIDNID